MKKFIPIILLTLLTSSCQKGEDPAIAAFRVYCETVSNDAKPISFHYPMEKNKIEALWTEFETIAQDFDVQLFREENLPESLLFPSEATEGKTVVIIYKGNRLEQYMQWKSDRNAYTGTDSKVLEGLARRLGRLLGYSPQGINELLRKNTSYRDLNSFGIEEQITHLYYDDLETAIDFYRNVLGLPQIEPHYFQISADGFIALHAFNGRFTPEQPKSTAIALLTDQLPQWYARIQEKGVAIKYTYKPKDGGAHDGFVAMDPGGYLLEFEQFKQHPENELFMAALSKSPKISTTIEGLNFYGTITWTYHNDLLNMQKFYEEVLGYPLVADQGWTKIYQTAPASFIGLVDERRGMEDYADEKAVRIEWKVRNFRAFEDYAKTNWNTFDTTNSTLNGPEKYDYLLRPLD
jgi:catechol 2,3-dioxygenase-like lactoylglutathione lyase family enzyme